jgi:hypothetical protein
LLPRISPLLGPTRTFRSVRYCAALGGIAEVRRAAGALKRGVRGRETECWPSALMCVTGTTRGRIRPIEPLFDSTTSGT